MWKGGAAKCWEKVPAELEQEPAENFARHRHPDQKFDDILVNPLFNISDWGGEKYGSAPRLINKEIQLIHLCLV